MTYYPVSTYLLLLLYPTNTLRLGHDEPTIEILAVDGVPYYPSVDLGGSPTNQIELVNKAYLQAPWGSVFYK